MHFKNTNSTAGRLARGKFFLWHGKFMSVELDFLKLQVQYFQFSDAIFLI